VVAFVAESANNARKGFHLLRDALESLQARRDLFLLVVGDAAPSLMLPSLQVGRVQGAAWLRQVYSAAHVFVIPSLEDNQPNTVLEAMACGTPVVGFHVGGIPEMVEEGRSGLLVPRGDVQQLAGALGRLLDFEEERAAMATQARRRVERVFSREGQVQKYLDLYSRLRAEREAREEVPDLLSRVAPLNRGAGVQASACRTE
jgi:glycosyltransferase involved in cell wall biosynthesis